MNSYCRKKRIMDKIILIIILGFLYSQCTHKHEILIAENHYDLGVIYRLELYSDSVFHFSMNQALKNDSITRCTGKFFLKNDTVIFPSPTYPIFGSTAIVKNGFLEFLDSTMPFKLQILKQDIVKKGRADSLKVSDVSIFTYMPKFYHNVLPNAIHYDLNNEDLMEIDDLVRLCIQENKDRLTMDMSSYDKQYVAVINQQKEKEVWVNCGCKWKYDPNGYKYRLIEADDGGDCYFNVKINLDKHKYYSLSVNGEV